MNDHELNATEDAAQTKPLWTMPTITVEPVQATAGDPTISDDGLGDGLFS